MQFDDIFQQYYTLYRAEAQIPNSADDEYTIALALSKEAINAWRTYDNVYWKELYSTLTEAADGDKTIILGQTSYTAPTNMQQYGGYVSVRNPSGSIVRRYPLLEPQDVQFKSDLASYCYFTGNPNTGYTLHLNGAPDSSIAGGTIGYIYYKKPTYFTTGTSTTEMSDPFFIVHRMLANRFRASRNPYTTSAKSDAENALRQMQLANNSGTWADPWSLPDRSGTEWGE